MPNYVYRAINQSGANVSGAIRADSVANAESMLSAQGYIPSKVVEESANAAAGWLQSLETKLTPVKPEELILFTKQFRTMLAAGISMLRLLEVLGNQTHNTKLKNAIASIAVDTSEGSTLYDAFRKHRDIFPSLYCSMIRAGEISGTLSEVLDRLVYIVEHEHKIKSDIKSALQYPMFVLITLGIAFVVLLTMIVPKFATIFTRAGLDLPLPTLISIGLYHFLRSYWYIAAGGAVGGIVAIRYYYKKTEMGKYLCDRVILHIPVLGPLFVKAMMSRFASVFSILQSSGIPVLSSLEILSGTIGNQAITRELNRVRQRVEEGSGISSPLKSVKYFTPMVVDMIAIGEESGQLEEMLRQISIHYDEEVEYAVKRLSDAIGPFLIVGLAVVVGFFALSIFLPMWDLTKLARH